MLLRGTNLRLTKTELTTSLKNVLIYHCKGHDGWRKDHTWEAREREHLVHIHGIRNVFVEIIQEELNIEHMEI